MKITNDKATNPVRSAVLVPVYRDEAGQPRVVVILRAPGGRHGSQIGFPGGKFEPDDANLLETAIRESQEEIGLERDNILGLEELPQEVTQTTGFVIQPYLAHVQKPAAWAIAPHEVDRVIEPNLAHLNKPGMEKTVVETHPRWDGPRRIEYFDVEGHRMWGATFRILKPLLSRLAGSNWRILD